MLEPHKDDLLEYIELTIHHAVLVERDPDDPAAEEVEHRLEGLWDRLSAEERRRAGVAGSRLNQIGGGEVAIRRKERHIRMLREEGLRHRQRAEAAELERDRAAVARGMATDRLADAVAILRRLVLLGEPDHTSGACWYCLGDHEDGRANVHTADCPLVAAGALLARLDKETTDERG